MKLKLKILKYLAHIFAGLGYISFIYEKQEQKKKISWWRVLGLLIIIFMIIGISSIFYVSSFYNTQIKNSDNTCGVVFGAAVWKNDIPSHALNDRIQEGVKLYKEKKINCLILSGGASTYGSHEVDVMKRIALENNVLEQDIKLDYAGTNTLITLRNLDKNQKKLVFISNDFHLARINLIAKKLGIKDFQVHQSTYLNGRYSKESYFFAREIGGVILLSFLL